MVSSKRSTYETQERSKYRRDSDETRHRRDTDETQTRHRRDTDDASDEAQGLVRSRPVSSGLVWSPAAIINASNTTSTSIRLGHTSGSNHGSSASHGFESADPLIIGVGVTDEWKETHLTGQRPPAK
jgi:hypothetical protein